IAMLLDLAADAMGDRIAVGGREDRHTYAEGRKFAIAASADVATKSNGTLAFTDANCYAVPVAMFAAAWAGASYAPLNYRLPPAQIQHLLERLDSGYVVEGDGKSIEWIEQLRVAATDEPAPYVED